MAIRVRILKNRGATIVKDTRHGEVRRFEPSNGSLRVDEAAAFLGVTVNRLYRRIATGELPHKGNGRGAWRIPLVAVKQLRAELAK